MSQPVLYVIAGPNGAGKTTFAMEMLPNFAGCTEFLNADLIAAGLAPLAPETQALQAGRLLLERMEELAVRRETFALETTLAGRAYARQLARLRAVGYRVELYFLWLPDVEVAVQRVARRVAQGGHNVPEPDIRRRHTAGVRNLFGLYHRLADNCMVFEVASRPPKLVARSEGEEWQIILSRQYRKLRDQAELP